MTIPYHAWFHLAKKCRRPVIGEAWAFSFLADPGSGRMLETIRLCGGSADNVVQFRPKKKSVRESERKWGRKVIALGHSIVRS